MNIIELFITIGYTQSIDDGIIEAIIHGKKEAVIYLITIGSGNISKALLLAIKYIQYEISSLLIPLASIDALDESMLLACSLGNIDIVRLLITTNIKNWNKYLYNACFKGHEEIVDLLLLSGANDINLIFRTAYNRDYKNLYIKAIIRGADLDQYTILNLEEDDIYYIVKCGITDIRACINSIKLIQSKILKCSKIVSFYLGRDIESIIAKY